MNRTVCDGVTNIWVAAGDGSSDGEDDGNGDGRGGGEGSGSDDGCGGGGGRSHKSRAAVFKYGGSRSIPQGAMYKKQTFPNRIICLITT